jgi:hypothetical protein
MPVIPTPNPSPLRKEGSKKCVGEKAVFPVSAAEEVAATRAGNGGKTAGNGRFPPGAGEEQGGKQAVLRQFRQQRQRGVLLQLLQQGELKVER